VIDECNENDACQGVTIPRCALPLPRLRECRGLFDSDIDYHFGAIIVSSGLAVLAFVQFDSVPMAPEVAVVALMITGLEGFVLTPTLMGRAARINGAAMFISILFWSWLWGVFGMIVAVPLMMVIKSVCDRIDRLEWVSEIRALKKVH
jgi:predicted PurR-regulated permease PerM